MRCGTMLSVRTDCSLSARQQQLCSILHVVVALSQTWSCDNCVSAGLNTGWHDYMASIGAVHQSLALFKYV